MIYSKFKLHEMMHYIRKYILYVHQSKPVNFLESVENNNLDVLLLTRMLEILIMKPNQVINQELNVWKILWFKL